MEIIARNVNQLFSDGFWRFKTSGVHSESRNGPVIRIEEPVMVTLKYPTERVLFNQDRDANPIFHCMEGIHILAGRRDVAFLKQFNSSIGNYSDDGVVFNAAYGYRMRHHFGRDQLVEVVEKLSTDRGTRQAVVQLWDSEDLSKDTLDRACNTQLIFAVVHDKINLTVNNRSNDFVWGMAGANAVHFSMLLEFVAGALDLPVGKMYTLTNNLHCYTSLYDSQRWLDNPPNSEFFDLYSQRVVRPLPMMLNADYAGFLQDCERFCDDPFNQEADYVHPFFKAVAHPMAMITRTRKLDAGTGAGWAAKVLAPDWRRASQDWIHRRELKKQSRPVS